MGKWNKQWIWLSGIGIGIIICAFLPQLIDGVYFKQGIWFTRTNFTRDQLLTFYGAFLSFIGTVLLGALALWQNINIHNIAIRQEALKNRAFFALVSVTDYMKYVLKKTEDKRGTEDVYIFNGDILDLDNDYWYVKGQYSYGLVSGQILTSVVLKNVGGNFAQAVTLSFIIGDKKLFWNKISAFAVGEEIVFYPLYNDLSKFKDKKMQLIIEFKDLFNNSYIQNIDVIIIEDKLAFIIDTCPVEKK